MPVFESVESKSEWMMFFVRSEWMNVPSLLGESVMGLYVGESLNIINFRMFVLILILYRSPCSTWKGIFIEDNSNHHQFLCWFAY